MKKSISLFLSAALMVSLLAGCSLFQSQEDVQVEVDEPTIETTQPDVQEEDSQSDTEDVTAPTIDADPINFVVLSGPTGVGAAKLMADSETGDTTVPVSASVAAANDEVVAQLASGEVDIAAIATNLAATLYAKTDGGVQMLNINTGGVLYILEKGNAVYNMADLQGKTIWTTGQGANPEYTLNYLLAQSGLTVGEDVFVEFMTAQEVSAKMVASEDGICMLPVPASTALMITDTDVRQAVCLEDVWQSVAGTTLPMGCLVVRTQFAQENPDLVDAFLADYQASIDFMSDSANIDEAAQLVADYGITANATIAAQAIPNCALSFITGDVMRSTIQSYFEVLFQADPSSIGGSIPYDDFYYNVS